MKEMNLGKQMRNVWEIPSPPAKEKMFGKHPTQKPVDLLNRIILASTKEGDLVLDPFCGSSTTGVSAARLNRKYVGIELEDEYLQLSVERLKEAIAERENNLFVLRKRADQ
jgi:site-specific DNA-methyltransferase (adenine-specific)